MRAALMTCLVLVPALALAGCAADDATGPAGGGTPGDDSEDPPSTSPPATPDRSTVWGRLVQREPADNVTGVAELTVEVERLDCERVDRRVTRRVDLSGLGDLPTPDPPLTLEGMSEVRTTYNQSGFAVTDPTRLDPGRLYLFVWNGTEASPDREPYVTRTPAVFVAYHGDNGTVEVSSARYPEKEPNLFLGDPEDPNRRTFQAAKRPWQPEDLKEGESFLLSLYRADDGEPWSLAQIARERPEAESCRHEHADDLAIQGPHRAMAFPADVTRQIDLEVANSQDEAITVSVDRVHLLNETAYAPHLPKCSKGQEDTDEARPGPEGGEGTTTDRSCAQQGFEERREGAILENCRAEPEAATVEVPPNATAGLTIEITCERTITEAEAEHLWLWGTASFTDELGLEHTLGEDRYDRWAAFEDVQQARDSASGGS